jgi:hypothetical protein
MTRVLGILVCSILNILLYSRTARASSCAQKHRRMPWRRAFSSSWLVPSAMLLVTTETAKSLNSDRLGLVQRNFFCRFFSIFNSERCSVGLLFPTYRAQKLIERGRGGVGDEGIYGGGGVGPSGTRRICACSPHHGRSNDMRLEEFGLYLRELEVIEIRANWGVFPM